VSATDALPAAVERILYRPEEIAAAVRRMAAEIADETIGEPLVLVPVLKGAATLAADLARALPATLDVRIDYLAVSSYGDSHRSSGHVRLVLDTEESIEGKHVVIVEDIVEEGRTVRFVQQLLGSRGPASLRTCALLDKPCRRQVAVSVDYLGFEVPDAFIVGYGLDHQEKYRNLPYLGTLRPGALDG
jgi:hypoxanthine phosphoribosyltransferase